MMKCRKCGGRTWTEQYDGVWWFRCVCGGMFPAEISNGNVTIVHTSADAMVLPTKGTALSRCLGTVATYGKVTTAQLAKKLKQDTCTTTAQLGALQVKGMIEKLNNRQGIKGGSSWSLTNKCQELFQ